MKLLLIALLAFFTLFSPSQSHAASYKISAHQVNPNGKLRSVTCRDDAIHCHFILPLASKTGVGTVDVNVAFEDDGEACFIFKFGVTELNPGICLKPRERQTITLTFPSESEETFDLHKDLVLRAHYRRVADVQLSVSRAGGR